MGNDNVDTFNVKEQIDFISEEARLKSFALWPHNNKEICNAEKMSQAGFYACGGESAPDLVKCYVCEKTLEGWEMDDDPWSEHRKHSPDCLVVTTGRKEAEFTVRQHMELTRILGLSVLKKQYLYNRNALLALKAELFKQS